MPKALLKKLRDYDPSLKDWGDEELAQAVVNKYGVYSDEDFAALNPNNIRQQSSFYDDWSDDDLSKALHQKFAPYLDEKEFQSRIGMNTIGKLGSSAQGLLQGATFGFGDEFAGADKAIRETLGDTGTKFYQSLPLSGAVSQMYEQFAPNDDELKELSATADKKAASIFDRLRRSYTSGRDQVRGDYERARREHPYVTTSSEVLGGVATGGVAGAGRNVTGRGLARGAVEAGKQGAKFGSIAGYGYSDYDPIDTLLESGFSQETADELVSTGQDVTTGGVVGGLTGAAFPLLASGVRNVARKVLKPFSTTVRTATLNEEGRRRVMQSVREDLRQGNITLETAQQELQSTPGMMVGDLGKNAQQMLDTIAQSATPAGNRVVGQLEKRALGQYDRIMPTVAKALGTGGDESNFVSLSQKILGNAKAQAAPLYEQAYTMRLAVTSPMKKLLEKPSAKAGIRSANILAKELGINMDDIAGKNVGDVGVETLDTIIQGMDDHVGSLFKRGHGKLATAAKETRDQFREMVYKATRDETGQSPYQLARKIWAGNKADNEALEMGLGALRDDADFTGALLRDMSESERTHFRVGVLRAIERVMKKTGDLSDITKKLGSNRYQREALETAFGDKKKFNQFLQLMKQEKKMFDTFSKATGNSSTIKRAAQVEAGNDLGGIIGMGTTSSVVPDASLYAYAAGRRMGRNAQEILFGNAMRGNQAALADAQANLLTGNSLNSVFTPQTMGGLLSPDLNQTSVDLTRSLLKTNVLPGLLSNEYGRPPERQRRLNE